MAVVRQDFGFPANPTIIPPDVRAATALEFIAHYLDRIEGHLEKLAGSVASTSAGCPLPKKAHAHEELSYHLGIDIDTANSMINYKMFFRCEAFQSVMIKEKH